MRADVYALGALLMNAPADVAAKWSGGYVVGAAVKAKRSGNQEQVPDDFLSAVWPGYGLTPSPARRARVACRSSNVTNSFAPISSAAATCMMSSVRQPIMAL